MIRTLTVTYVGEPAEEIDQAINEAIGAFGAGEYCLGHSPRDPGRRDLIYEFENQDEANAALERVCCLSSDRKLVVTLGD
jgi:hypothetical protein